MLKNVCSNKLSRKYYGCAAYALGCAAYAVGCAAYIHTVRIKLTQSSWAESGQNYSFSSFVLLH